MTIDRNKIQCCWAYYRTSKIP